MPDFKMPKKYHNLSCPSLVFRSMLLNLRCTIHVDITVVQYVHTFCTLRKKNVLGDKIP